MFKVGERRLNDLAGLQYMCNINFKTHLLSIFLGGILKNELCRFFDLATIWALKGTQIPRIVLISDALSSSWNEKIDYLREAHYHDQ
jgi:hypothetical protein